MTPQKAIAVFIVCTLFAFGYLALCAWVFEMAWDNLFTVVWDFKPIDFWQALAFIIIINLFMAVFRWDSRRGKA